MLTLSKRKIYSYQLNFIKNSTLSCPTLLYPTLPQATPPTSSSYITAFFQLNLFSYFYLLQVTLLYLKNFMLDDAVFCIRYQFFNFMINLVKVSSGLCDVENVNLGMDTVTITTQRREHFASMSHHANYSMSTKETIGPENWQTS